MMAWLLVAGGGFAGAVCRFALSGWSRRRLPSAFPAGTLFINSTGSFLLGWLAGSGWLSGWTGLLFGTGFLGAYTTFSTVNMDSLRLGLTGKWRLMWMYLAFTYTAGIGLAFAGYWLGSR